MNHFRTKVRRILRACLHCMRAGTAQIRTGMAGTALEVPILITSYSTSQADTFFLIIPIVKYLLDIIYVYNME
jgi:hypothetical protein